MSGAHDDVRLLILAGLLSLAPGPRHAQVSPDDARRTLDVLQDPQKRDQLVKTLQTIAQTQPTPACTAPRPTVPIAPGSLGAEVLIGASGFLNHLSSEMIAAFGAVRSVPLFWRWLTVMATDPRARGVLLDTAWRLAVILAVGLAARMGGAPRGAAPDRGPGPPGAAMATTARRKTPRRAPSSGETEPPQVAAGSRR